MLCKSVMSFDSWQYKQRKTSREIFDANFQGKPVDVDGKLYPSFSTYKDVPRDDKGKPLFEMIVAYGDTADTGADFLFVPVGGVYKGEAWILDALYTDEPMEVTEPETAAILYSNEVEYALFEGNNGGSGFARNVKRLLWENHKTRKVDVEWFHQSENKQARILSNATYVCKHIYFPEAWEKRWPALHAALSSYQRKGKNAHDDAPDGITGLAEMVQNGVKRKISFGFRWL